MFEDNFVNNLYTNFYNNKIINDFNMILELIEIKALVTKSFINILNF